MRNPYQRKAASKTQNSAYDPLQVYKSFIETIVAQASIYALYQDGWALCATPTGQKAFATWQSKGLAKLLIKDNWEKYEVQEITLKDFVEKVIPFLRQENTTLSLDLTPEGQNILVAPEKFLLDIKNYLYQIYVQKPELFKNAAIPLPRQIRLNS
ncbi:hypothetical protein A3K93_09000 [Acinetobacter sp. NCu2D-2]|uniref:DUF2750 domain-containing protein n=1 Tax=Acinetobacter wanghuae TaxID=2662362 RepID=A0A5Q0P5L0_9GAMM|nr:MULTISPECIES: DUF2750 domain-containing protein [Acinetobacter]ANF82320.1 hypothetical protein A3K93_09000 [Acinetobacter sp. NCu2D-2]MQW91439.1 DUF2750 domain-containing protein [Acinetobacter wanghuae]QGA11660.1 DUF2750 domain-containing protein [Acinetobacter wanghuae]